MGQGSFLFWSYSDCSSRNEEPFVIDAVDWCWRKFFVFLDVSRIWILPIGGVLNTDIGPSHLLGTVIVGMGYIHLQGYATWLSLANNQPFPGFCTFADNVSGISAKVLC